MPVAHLYCTERVIHVPQAQLEILHPSIHNLKGSLADPKLATQLDVFDENTLTDITPPCFKKWVEKEVLPDTRFMLDAAPGGESAEIQTIAGKGTTRILHQWITHDGSQVEEAGRGAAIVSAEHKNAIIGHKNALGWFIGGLVFHLAPSQIQRYRRFYVTPEE